MTNSKEITGQNTLGDHSGCIERIQFQNARPGAGAQCGTHQSRHTPGNWVCTPFSESQHFPGLGIMMLAGRAYMFTNV